MFKGETVTVETKVETGRDAHNNPVYEAVRADVGGVLVAVGQTADIGESNRPEGVSVSYTLYFPKTFEGGLENARVMVRGEWFDIVGKPLPWLQSPTDWNMVAEAVVNHG